MSRVALVYHDGYDLHFGDHVFPSVKYRLIRERLIGSGFAKPEEIHQPEPASDEDVLLVHTPEWVKGLKTGTLSYAQILRLEVPYSQQMVRAFWLAAGGTTLAARLALRQGVGFNIGGGFHHAFPDHGEGFCAIHDVAIAIRKLQREGVIRRAMVVDCDVHHGNGTAAIFPEIGAYSRYPFINSTTIRRKNRPPRWIYTWRMGRATRSTSKGWPRHAGLQSPDLSPRFFSTWRARIPTSTISWVD